MVAYEVDISYDLPQDEFILINADDLEDAEFKAIDDIKNLVPDARNIIIENIKEVKNK